MKKQLPFCISCHANYALPRKNFCYKCEQIEVKAKRREYQQKPEVKAKQRECRTLAYMKVLQQNKMAFPEVMGATLPQQAQADIAPKQFQIPFSPAALTQYEREMCNILLRHGALQPIQIYYLILDRCERNTDSGYNSYLRAVSEQPSPPKESRALINPLIKRLKNKKVEYPSFSKILRHLAEMKLIGWFFIRREGRSTYYCLEKSIYEQLKNEANEKKRGKP